ncbi:hypothetical protein [Ferrimonas futtsuensis]|uniref:hypothetical protein n=1 Tax=Ferrimonas futtsuensis TaxID=364764 RepID=UPI00041BB378|nr:hypothetical protein [Ferrimonas futtsuensis]
MSVDAFAVIGGIAIGCLFALILCNALALKAKVQSRAETGRDTGIRQHLEEYRRQLHQVSAENQRLRQRVQELEYEVEPLRQPGKGFRGDPLDASFRVKSVR